MLFDINGGELLVILAVAALVIGPSRLPGYAEQLGALVRKARVWIKDTRTRIDAEAGDTGVDWEALDPRKYDPRRIVRDALLEPEQATPAAGRAPSRVGPAQATGTWTPPVAAAASTGPIPFDDEAT